ncbi:MAG: restriction endonuclease [Elusimicrobiales bacterium]
METAFGMGSGYVLNFSNYSFRAFVHDTVGLDIEDVKYSLGTGSKANRLRAFWSKESDHVVGKLLNALLEYFQEGRRLAGQPLTPEDKRLHVECLSVANRLLGINVKTSVSNSVSPLARELKEELRKKLLGLSALSPQERGYAFEKFLQEVFSAFKMSPRAPFRITGEQIDGSLELDGETYLIEAKWQNALVDSKELYAFYGKIDGKAAWSRGLFISYSGFSKESLDAFSKGKRPNFITLDGQDLNFVLTVEGGVSIDLPECIRKKVRYAAETGIVNLSAYDILKGKT